MTPMQWITLRAPQWATDPRLSSTPSLIDLATIEAIAFTGDDKDKAIALFVMHWFALESQNGGNPGSGGGTDSGYGHGGRVVSKSEGQLSISYSSGSGYYSSRYEDLAGTQYGLELLRMIKALAFKPRTRTM
jgi:hypothetical protein